MADLVVASVNPDGTACYRSDRVSVQTLELHDRLELHLSIGQQACWIVLGSRIAVPYVMADLMWIFHEAGEITSLNGLLRIRDMIGELYNIQAPLRIDLSDLMYRLKDHRKAETIRPD